MEMARRGMWAVLRLEAEHLHNTEGTEGFRRVAVIPLHFDRKRPVSPKGADRKGAGGLSKRAKERMAVVGEVIAYICILAALAYLTAEAVPGDDGGGGG